MKILEYPWHQVHLYRLATALSAQFTVCAVRQPAWNVAQRPIPENVAFVSPQQVHAADYDVAILHLDQWCDRLNLRAFPYRLMKQISQGIPQIIIMHGTPDDEANRRAMLRLIGDLPVVCNSRQAAREWDSGEGRSDCYGLPQFRTIIHGYVDEFYNFSLEDRPDGAITICSGGEMSREYHGLPLVERLKRDVPLVWYGPAGDRSWASNYDDYRTMLAQARVYFSPTRRGPMPGARSEAMLSGCCVVSVPGNDVEDFIEQGNNGYIAHTYVEARDLLMYLDDNPTEAYEVGQRGRGWAIKAFDPWRYSQDWLSTLLEIGVWTGN